MKKISLLVFTLVISGFLCAQVPAYYLGINFAASSVDLRNALSDRISDTHTTFITYDLVWDVLKQSDLDPTNAANVLLIYGYNDSDGDLENDRSRNKNDNGGSSGEWNREHVFPKSLGSPDLGTSGPGSDAHNLRACDVATNGYRSNRLFADGSGNAGNVGANWYPGDEWKGDCARIVMYMYLRYDLRCRPIYVAAGSVNAMDANMIDVLLDWNAEDPVSELEENRNDVIYGYQGNRNPFIDNPKIATLIWGGPDAEDKWGGVGLEEINSSAFSVYPNPVIGDLLHIESRSNQSFEGVKLFNVSGKLVYSSTLISTYQEISTQSFEPGVYFLSIQTANGNYQKKVILK